jgi:hypothetical protein
VAANPVATRPASEDVKTRTLANYAKLPLSFEENRGQADSSVKFLSHGTDYSILLTSSKVFLNLPSKGTAAAHSTIGVTFPGASSSPAIRGDQRQLAVSSYFLGNDPAKWVAGAENYARVHYRELYPGIDLAFYGNQGRLEYDFVVAPGANPQSILLQFDGVDGMRLDGGDLVLKTAAGEIRQRQPVIYQEIAGARHALRGGYAILPHNRVSFEIAAYDRSKTLVIDPTLTFATYLGSPGEEDFGLSAAATTTTYPAVAVDYGGNVYVTGYNGSTASSFTGHPTILTGTDGGGSDVFVLKMNPTGTAVVYSVVFGGGLTDIGSGIAVDVAGNAYVVGYTTSPNFPVTAGVPQNVLNGGTNAFVTKVNAAGTALVYSTFLGGSGNFWGRAIALDQSTNAYVTGTASYVTGGPSFPLVSPISSTPSSGFLTEVNAAGSAFAYSTYLPAGIGYGIAVDSSAAAYVTGSTASATSPSPAQGYVLKVNPAGAGIAYGPVLLGHSGTGMQTIGFGIAVDTSENAYVAGMTNDSSFPQISGGAAQTTYGGGLTDGFAIKLSSSGVLVYGTYIGGLGSNFLPERGSGIGVDLEGNAYVSGTTQCIGFPSINTISDARNGGPSVLMKGSISGSTSNWSPTSLAGSFDQVNALAFDPSGNLYAGASASNASGGGVFKLLSGSSTWTSASSGITSSTIDSLAVDPASPSTVYTAGSSHVFQTTNGGSSWTTLSPAGVTSPAVLAVAKTSPNSTVYLGSSAGILYSTNGGSIWNTPSTAPSGAINVIVVDPNSSSVAYAGGANGVFQTINGGVTWSAVTTGLPTGSAGVVSGMAVYSGHSPSTIYAATPNGLFYTSNASGGWTLAILSPELDSTPQLVAVDAGDNVYLAFQGAGMATATGGGTSSTEWSNLTYNGLTQNQVLAIATPPGSSGTAYAGIVAATEAFLTKIAPNGQSFLSSTCIGGSDNNLGQNIAVTPGGSVYVSGLTTATNFPATPGAVQTSNAGLYDDFTIGVLGDTTSSGGAPTVVVQNPVDGAILSGTYTISGYALDAFPSGATAISSVQVWLDGTYVTTATYGVSNPGACTATPSAPGCPNVGFTYVLITSSVTPGPHTLDFYALDSSSPANVGTASFQFTAVTSFPAPYVFGSGPGPDVIWEEPVVGWAQVWYLTCPPCSPPDAASNLTEANPWNIVGIGDFNGDGTPDVVWQDPVSGAVQVWYLGGPLGTTLIGAADITVKNPWRVVSVADFNQDGHPDLLWQDPVNGFSQVWYLSGSQGTTLIGAADLDKTNPWNIVGTGDFNNDGFPDVLWQDPVSGTVQIWYMGGTTPGAQGTQLQSAINLTGPMTTKVVAIADFNNDGHQDVIFQDTSTGAATVYFYTGANGTTPNGTAVLSTGNPWYIAGPH